jgi:hypothetical protein
MNILEWLLDLEAQVETHVNYSFTVQYPRSMQISGLRE